MFYQFKCDRHGEFMVNQPMLLEHKAKCPVCYEEAERVYSSLQWRWEGEAFRPDGSKRQDNDYAVLKG